MGNISSYLLALWHNWIWFVTGGPFLAERLARQFWPDYDAWIARYATPATRMRVTISLAVVGFLIANYLAYSGEHERAERLSGVPAVHRHITPAEAAEIKAHFAGAASSIPVIPICSVSDPESEIYAQNFWDAFHEAGMVPQMIFNCTPMADADSGLFVGLRDQDHPSSAASEFMKRFLAAGFRIKETKIKERQYQLLTDFDLFISLPERE